MGGDHGLEGPLVFAGVVRHVRRGAAHIEADDLVEPAHLGGAHGADDAARRARKDRVLALEEARIDKPAIRLHEHELRVAELAGNHVDIAAQDRREIGIDDGGVAAADQLHQRADSMAHRDLREADLAGEFGNPALMLGIAVTVQQHDRGRTNAGIMSGAEIVACPGDVDLAQLLAFRGYALVDLHDALVEQLGQNDMADEEFRAVLIGNAQRVGEALGDYQDGAFALAFKQRVGRDRRPHLDRVDGIGGQRGVGSETKQVADALQRRVAILLGVLREQLVGDQTAIGPPRDHVRKGAAAVNPELPTHRRHPTPAPTRLRAHSDRAAERASSG